MISVFLGLFVCYGVWCVVGGKSLVDYFFENGWPYIAVVVIAYVVHLIVGVNRKVEVSPDGLNIVKCGRQDKRGRLSVRLGWDEVASMDRVKQFLTSKDGSKWRITSPENKSRGGIWKPEERDLWLCIEWHFHHYGSTANANQ